MKRLLLLLFLMGVSFITFVVIHEHTHKQIALNYGCKKVEIVWFNGAYSTTTCLEYNPRTEQMQQQERYLQSLAELIGYNLQILIISAWCMLWAWIFYKELKEME